VLSFRASLAFVLFAALAAPPVFASTVHRAHGSSHKSGKNSGQSSAKKNAHSSANTSASASHSKRGRKAAATSHRLRGQQAIAPERVTQIQQALIRVHYLDGEASGTWDATTKAAMQKYQADQGWQTKLMPDSRALKKLGLGPDYSNAINAKDSSFGAPPPASTIPPATSAGFADASGVKQ
jgi:peptidoglycan hydrolase-like protein with peptidoglycan-binding domain